MNDYEIFKEQSAFAVIFFRRPCAGFEYNVSNIRFTISNIGYSCSLNFSSCPINA